jgi:hypothetical protein
MQPVIKNISIYKGDTFTLDFRVRGRTATGGPGAYVNLTGASAKASIKSATGGSVLGQFVCTVPDQSVSENVGKVQVRMEAAVTAGLPDSGGVWDCQVTFADGTVRTYLKGSVSVTPDVTS